MTTKIATDKVEQSLTLFDTIQPVDQFEEVEYMFKDSQDVQWSSPGKSEKIARRRVCSLMRRQLDHWELKLGQHEEGAKFAREQLKPLRAALFVAEEESPGVFLKATFSSAQEAETWANKTLTDIHRTAGQPVVGGVNVKLDMERGRLSVFSVNPDTHTKQVTVKIARDDNGCWTFSGLTASFWEKEDVLSSPDF